MALLRSIALSLIVAAGIGANCANASTVTIRTPATPTHLSPPVWGDIRPLHVIKTTKGPASRHPVLQCPPGEKPGWGTRPGKVVCRPER